MSKLPTVVTIALERCGRRGLGRCLAWLLSQLASLTLLSFAAFRLVVGGPTARLPLFALAAFVLLVLAFTFLALPLEGIYFHIVAGLAWLEFQILSCKLTSSNNVIKHN